MLVVAVAASPIPTNSDRSTGRSLFYALPGAYPAALAGPAIPVRQVVVEQQPSSYATRIPINVRPLAADRYGDPQNINLVLSVPSAVPAGTSVSVTINVNAEPTGTVVSVSNPVVSQSPAQKPPAPMTTAHEAIAVDAGEGILRNLYSHLTDFP